MKKPIEDRISRPPDPEWWWRTDDQEEFKAWLVGLPQEERDEVVREFLDFMSDYIAYLNAEDGGNAPVIIGGTDG